MNSERILRDHERLAKLIELVLRNPNGHMRVTELATQAGFSRFHLTRIFQAATGETLEQFLRRMRLERSAYALKIGGQGVAEISAQAGYRSPEAFSRSFRASFGMLPTAYRKLDLDWKLPSPTDLHWNPDWLAEFKTPPFTTLIVERPTITVAVWRVVRNYAHLDESWELMAKRFEGQIPAKGRFVTLYWDNIWTHPVSNTMRADIGWVLGPGAELPKGMRRRIIPAGRYVATVRYVERTERNDAWSYMSGAFPSAREAGSFSFDEYPEWPLPFEKVKTRLFVSA